MYNISDSRVEYQIKDRLSFMRFLGLALCDTVPDKKTVWEFHGRLVQTGIIDSLFYRLRGSWRKRKQSPIAEAS
jgi:IS5 family transposase